MYLYSLSVYIVGLIGIPSSHVFSTMFNTCYLRFIPSPLFSPRGEQGVLSFVRAFGLVLVLNRRVAPHS